ncbi:MAG: CDP-glycerol glycerophosphotransferase family protein [Chloroflexota bacterium]
MADSPTPPRGETAPVLFVAREPDETLRTFLPVIRRLAEEHGVPSQVVFHHTPGRGAVADLESLNVRWSEVTLPPADSLGGSWFAWAPRRLIRPLDELIQLCIARRLADDILRTSRPSAVVVIQDTLLLERFVVRAANERGIPTVVVQWAFSYPQELYDRLRAIRQGKSEGRAAERPRPSAGGVVYRLVRRALGLEFDLVNSYGGGEARTFAVMGQAFADQYERQGVHSKRIVVTGHPSHDATFERARATSDADRHAIRQRYGIAADRRLVLYATQPVLWRRVMTAEQLRSSIRSIASAVAAAPDSPHLVIKLHPREDPADYAFCAALNPPMQVIPTADMWDLIAAADVFISSSSSTVLLAMMLDKPIITVNFDEVPHFDVFEGIGATLHVRTAGQFAAALKLVLDDPSTQRMLAEQRKDVIDRYTRFDGQATERVAALLVNAIPAGARSAAE